VAVAEGARMAPAGQLASSTGSGRLDRLGRLVRAGRFVRAGRLRPHAAAGCRGRAVRPRRHDDEQGRDRRRRRGHPARGLLLSGQPADLRRRHRSLQPGRSGRRDHGLERADPQRAALARRRRFLPAHAHLDGADRGQRRGTTRRSWPSGRCCAGLVVGRHPHRADGLRHRVRLGRGARPPSTTWSIGPRPRSTRSPSGARARTTPAIEDLLQGTWDELEHIMDRGGVGTGVPTSFAPPR